MDEDDFDLLGRIHFRHKNVITETKTKPSQIEAKFDFDEIERNSLLQMYNGVLPYGDRISLTIDGIDHPKNGGSRWARQMRIAHFHKHEPGNWLASASPNG
jgi:hypothetical protein